MDVVEEDDPRAAVPQRREERHAVPDLDQALAGPPAAPETVPGDRREDGVPAGSAVGPVAVPVDRRRCGLGTADVRTVTSMPASAQSVAMRWACSSEPPASGSSRSRQATKWARRSPASAAIAARTSRPAWAFEVGGTRTSGGDHRADGVSAASSTVCSLHTLAIDPPISVRPSTVNPTGAYRPGGRKLRFYYKLRPVPGFEWRRSRTATGPPGQSVDAGQSNSDSRTRTVDRS